MDIGVSACVFADAIGSRLKTSSMIESRESQPRFVLMFIIIPKLQILEKNPVILKSSSTNNWIDAHFPSMDFKL